MKAKYRDRYIFPLLFVFFVAGTVLLIVLGTEYLLGRGRVNPPSGSSKRYIRLRELYVPGTEVIAYPSDAYMKTTDSLEQKEYPVRIDDNGFIMPSKVHEDPELTIVFLGGSTTESIFVDELSRFPYLVGRLVESATDKRTNSYNGGMSGINSLDSINILINKVIPLQPNIVVMTHNCNDRAVLIYEGTYWNNNPTRSPIVQVDLGFRDARTLLKKNFEYFLPNISVRVGEFWKVYIKGQPAETDEFAEARKKENTFNEIDRAYLFGQNLRIFVRICRGIGAIPVLMTQPQRNRGKEWDENKPYEWHANQKYFNDLIRAIGAEEGVRVIDLARTLPPSPDYIYDFLHYNTLGSERVAAIITNELLDAIK